MHQRIQLNAVEEHWTHYHLHATQSCYSKFLGWSSYWHDISGNACACMCTYFWRSFNLLLSLTPYNKWFVIVLEKKRIKISSFYTKPCKFIRKAVTDNGISIEKYFAFLLIFFNHLLLISQCINDDYYIFCVFLDNNFVWRHIDFIGKCLNLIDTRV